MHTFRPSIRKVFIVISVFILVLGIVFGYQTKGNNIFNFEGAVLGGIVGAVFGLFVLFYGLGQQLKLNQDNIQYFSNILVLIFNKGKEIALHDVQLVYLGIPKINKNLATFSAINITGADKEISFNPDLYDKYVLQRLFRELKQSNPDIKFDNYGMNMIETADGDITFQNRVGKYFIVTILTMFTGSLLVVVTKKVFPNIPNEFIYGQFALFLFLLPFIFNRIIGK